MDDFQDDDDQQDFQPASTFYAKQGLGQAQVDVSNDGEDEDFQAKQRLKAAIHYFVGQIAEAHVSQGLLASVSGTEQMGVSKKAVAAAAEFVYGFAESVAVDVEAFAKHAKRTTVNCDDVRLCARKSPELQSKLNAFAEKLNIASEQRKQNVKRKKKGDTKADSDAVDKRANTNTTTNDSFMQNDNSNDSNDFINNNNNNNNMNNFSNNNYTNNYNYDNNNYNADYNTNNYNTSNNNTIYNANDNYNNYNNNYNVNQSNDNQFNNNDGFQSNQTTYG